MEYKQAYNLHRLTKKLTLNVTSISVISIEECFAILVKTNTQMYMISIKKKKKEKKALNNKYKQFIVL